jgi:hypothetical protein
MRQFRASVLTGRSAHWQRACHTSGRGRTSSRPVPASREPLNQPALSALADIGRLLKQQTQNAPPSEEIRNSRLTGSRVRISIALSESSTHHQEPRLLRPRHAEKRAGETIRSSPFCLTTTIASRSAQWDIVRVSSRGMIPFLHVVLSRVFS